MSNLKVSCVRDYFQSLNPIAKRICEDLDSTRESYESAWDQLSQDEQHQVINESLIFPDAVLKYHLEAVQQSPVETFPILKLNFASKVLQDETGAMWKDEHSAPFTWKTPSQLDITLESQETRIEGTPSKELNREKKKRPAGPPPPPPPKGLPCSIPLKVEPATEPGNMSLNFHVTEVSGKETFGEPDQSQVMPKEKDSDNAQCVALKTGFDFLDNW